MCGIAGALSLNSRKIDRLSKTLEVMNILQKHRGPDGGGTWEHKDKTVGFAHRRLSIIDLSPAAQQPMRTPGGNWITYNGEIYNYKELREELGADNFSSHSDTEVILQAYERWGVKCLDHLRGMFSFALWDEAEQTFFCARDRFGIKPLFHAENNGVFYFASEAKALLPFIKDIETDKEGFKDYLAFQFCLHGKTLFKGISELQPGHYLKIRHGKIESQRYWQVYYNVDFSKSVSEFQDQTEALLQDSVKMHLRADVPVGAYVSGGLDSSLVASMASRTSKDLIGFTGKFSLGREYDESQYARDLAKSCDFKLYECDITSQDFIDNIRRVIYHLDQPIAGPGSFAQYMVSGLASKHRKVVLGGQGGDETFGGYARYLIAYFEQCIKAAIEGTSHNGNFIVTYESIIPNLTALKNYKPMLKEFWRDGLFEDIDRRYFRLINRTNALTNEINWEALTDYSPFESFLKTFRAENVSKESYFDSMTHFDFKTLLPALLHVEDRVSMAHGLESRVPILDHPLIEFAATMPSNVKFENGTMKNLLKRVAGDYLPDSILNRQDKMGFPVPLVEWINNETKDFVLDLFGSLKAQNRDIVNNRVVTESFAKEPKFGRKAWGLISMEIWQQEFHDKAFEFKRLME